MSLFVVDREGKRPENARLVGEEQIIEFYTKVLSNWKPKREVWFITNGPVVLGVASAITGMYANQYFRKKLRVGRYGQFSTYLPTTLIPLMVTASFHQLFVQKEVLLNPTGCPICLHTRAIAIQFAFGIVQPSILAPLATLMFATRHFTYRIPSPIYQRKAFFQFVYKIAKPVSGPLGIQFALHCLAAAFITHKELDTLYRVHKKILPGVDEEDSVDTEVKRDVEVAETISTNEVEK